VLEATEWTAADLVGEDVAPEAEQRLPAFTTATQAEKFKEEEQGVATFREWIYSKKEDVSVNYQPSGPNWSPAAQALPTPRVSGIWFVHERQNENGKHIPWLFFKQVLVSTSGTGETWGDGFRQALQMSPRCTQ